MKDPRWSLALLFAGLAAGCATAPETTRTSPWEKDVLAFEATDRERPPSPGGIVFVGSSSIRLWELAASFPDLEGLNRGFGGSQLADAVELAPRIVLPRRPRAVVLYAGDNDVAAGKSAEVVFSDFRAFVAAIRSSLPEARITFISIKPSLKRWALFPEMQRANELIRSFTALDPRLAFADVAALMLGPDGRPRPELYAEDGLHLSPEGYRLWTSVLRPLLTAEP